MRQHSKLAALALALTLLLAACSGTNTPADSQTEAPKGAATQAPEVKTENTPAPADEKPLELSIFMPNTAQIDRSSSPVLDVIMQKTNTKITMVEAAGDEWKQKLSVLISSGTEPNLMLFGQGEIYMLNKYAADGFMVPWNDPASNLMQSSMPNASARIQPDAIAKLSNREGLLYALPQVRDIGYGAYFVRTDWLTKLGMEKPTTLEEYKEMLRRFTEEDPDGNGKNDTWGLIADKNGNFELFAGPFGLPLNDWFEENGQLAYGSTHPRMKDALAFATEVYKAGYIHPDSTTMDSKTKEQLMSSGVIGLWHGVSSGNANIMKALREVVPTAANEVLPVPVAAGVEKGISSIARIIENVDNKPKSISGVLAMSAKVPEDTRQKLASFVDWHYSDEGNAAITYGVESDSYKKEGDKYIIDTEKYNLDKLRQIGAWDVYTYTGYIAQRNNWYQLWDEQTVANMTNTAWSAWPKQVYFVTPKGEQIEFEVEAKRVEIFQQVVSGTMTVEEGWTKWLAEFERLGGADWTKEMQEEFAARK